MCVVGCGGAGINLAQHFVNTGEAGYAEIDVFTVDTSRSNLTDKLDPSKVYLFDGMDGSGKLRAVNYEQISERAKELVQKIGTPDIINVIHSASGGSGSVIAPVLVSELVKKGRPLTVTLIGSTGSRIEIENTLKTLKSYAAISDSTGVPIAVTYFENSASNPRGSVDQQVRMHVIMTSLFFSGKHRELDTADLQHFLNYPKVTSYKPSMVKLDFFDGHEITLNKDEAIIGVVTLTDEDKSADIKHPIEYQAVGFLPSVVKQNTTFNMPIHMVLVANAFAEIAHRLDARLREADDTRSAFVHRSIVDNSIQTTKEGLVL
jgi:hypothetical protein